MAGFCTLLVPFPSPPPFPGPTVILSGLSSLHELHKFRSLFPVCSDEFPSHLSWYCHMFLFYMYIKLISHCYFCFMQPAFTQLYTHVFSFCHSLIFPEFLPLTLELFFSCLRGVFFFFFLTFILTIKNCAVNFIVPFEEKVSFFLQTLFRFLVIVNFRIFTMMCLGVAFFLSSQLEIHSFLLFWGPHYMMLNVFKMSFTLFSASSMFSLSPYFSMKLTTTGPTPCQLGTWPMAYLIP